MLANNIAQTKIINAPLHATTLSDFCSMLKNTDSAAKIRQKTKHTI